MGIMTMKRVLLLLVIAVAVAGCGQKSDQQNSAPRTDIGPITQRLPKLGTLESVCWTSTQVTTDSFVSPPGQPAYRVQGFAKLTKGTSEEISERYEWLKVAVEAKSGLVLTNVNLSKAEWSQSDTFTKDSKPQQIPGELYFERQKGVVYFDLEIE